MFWLAKLEAFAQELLGSNVERFAKLRYEEPVTNGSQVVQPGATRSNDEKWWEMYYERWAFTSWSLQNLILSMSFEQSFDAILFVVCRGGNKHRSSWWMLLLRRMLWGSAEWRTETSKVLSSRQQSVKGIRPFYWVMERDRERLNLSYCWLVVKVASNLQKLQLTQRWSKDVFFGGHLGFWQFHCRWLAGLSTWSEYRATRRDASWAALCCDDNGNFGQREVNELHNLTLFNLKNSGCVQPGLTLFSSMFWESCFVDR